MECPNCKKLLQESKILKEDGSPSILTGDYMCPSCGFTQKAERKVLNG